MSRPHPNAARFARYLAKQLGLTLSEAQRLIKHTHGDRARIERIVDKEDWWKDTASPS
ncbi:hypothetical protein [Gemmatimonas sp. UBA7669]|uniref:hypothetical protein n=1 Tax=Gemmatimonas sp. UBA7669 TaxID=1946568 RepID=UPI0025BFC0DD|nr:hypothetical protein [Gemmatimonas sp. UBA7669]